MTLDVVEGRDFEIVPDNSKDDPEEVCSLIRILTGDSYGALVRVGLMKFDEFEDDEGNVRMLFDFELVLPPLKTTESLKTCEERLKKDGDFNHLLGSILFKLLEDQLEKNNDGSFSVRDSDIKITEDD